MILVFNIYYFFWLFDFFPPYQQRCLYLRISRSVFNQLDVPLCNCMFANMQQQLFAEDSQTVGLLTLLHAYQRDHHNLGFWLRV